MNSNLDTTVLGSILAAVYGGTTICSVTLMKIVVSALESALCVEFLLRAVLNGQVAAAAKENQHGCIATQCKCRGVNLRSVKSISLTNPLMEEIQKLQFLLALCASKPNL